MTTSDSCLILVRFTHAILWARGDMTDAQLMLSEASYGNWLWIASLRNKQGIYDVKRVLQTEAIEGLIFRTRKPRLVEWADKQRLQASFYDGNGQWRFYGVNPFQSDTVRMEGRSAGIV